MKGAFSSTVYRGLPFFGGQPLPRCAYTATTPGFVVLAISQPMLGQSSRRKARCAEVPAVRVRFSGPATSTRHYSVSGTLTTHHIRNAGEVLLIVADGGRNSRQTDRRNIPRSISLRWARPLSVPDPLLPATPEGMHFSRRSQASAPRRSLAHG